MRLGVRGKSLLLAGTLAVLCGVAGRAAEDRTAVKQAALPPVSPAQAEFFETRVRPLLFSRCYSCHGEKLQQGALRLDSRAGMLRGGGSGMALVPGAPEKSALIKAVHYEGGLKMPPTGKLPQAEIETLTEWVKMGAPWPDAKSLPAGASNADGEYVLTDAQKKFWSFQPVRKPALPKGKETAWARTPMDRFILAKLEARGLTPAAQADRRTLIRRASFDLIGLPPTPEETDAFLGDKSPNAFAKVVDRLLADPRYGERWARHWLDVARYADTKGYVFVEDSLFHHAYTYRDWVVRAFNEDLPYDQFVTLQLAADKLVTSEDTRPLAAMGFLTLGRRFLNDPVFINDDRIDVTMRGLQGLTVACARCHNHKFDPIPATDYYSLYGIFASSIEPAPQPVGPKTVNATYAAWQKQFSETQGNLEHQIQSEVVRLRKLAAAPAASHPALAADIPGILQKFREGTPVPDNLLPSLRKAFTPDAQAQVTSLQGTLAELRKHPPTEPPLALTLVDADKLFDPYVFIHGNPGRRGDSVPRRFLLCLSGPDRKPFTQGSGRLELAQAIADKSNPLTARVFVNRVWLYHFGQGIVRTPSDFGFRGEPPTHPELLDYLASRFMEEGWSIKKLQRLILLSSTYQQSSNPTPRALALDPENRLLAHQNRQRLDLEALRDSLLAVAGRLDPTIGGPAVELTTAPYSTRRTLYGFINRQNLQGMYRTFDFASPDSSSAQRYHTMVPQQALFMMNSPFVIEQAQALAQQSEVAKSAEETQRIRALYRRLFDRLPEPDEIALGLRFLHSPDSSPAPSTAPVWRFGYGYYDPAQKQVTEFTSFAHFTGQAWQVGKQIPDPQLHYVMLTANGGHPGPGPHSAAIRRWTAPVDALVSIRGTLAHPSDQGDGVHAAIVSSRQGLVAEWNAFHTEVKTAVVDVEVKRGDTLDFIVDCRGNEGYDSFRWAPIIRTTGKSGVQAALAAKAQTQEWDSAAEFGPIEVPAKRLTPWEQYVQALMMTNEFSFVD